MIDATEGNEDVNFDFGDDVKQTSPETL